jgi:hypothetical protein
LAIVSIFELDLNSMDPYDRRPPPVAQLDRAPGFEPGCREFESLRAGHFRYFACLIDCLVLD